MDKTASSCAVDKYMSKISKVLACTKKLGERRFTERKVVSSNPGRTINQGL